MICGSVTRYSVSLAKRVNDFWTALLLAVAELGCVEFSGAAITGFSTSAWIGVGELDKTPWGRGEISDPVGRLE